MNATFTADRIPLKAQDGTIRAYALVDPEDFAEFGHLRWNLNVRGYVTRKIPNPDRLHRRDLLLHRAIMGCVHGDGVLVDHRDGNPLDNRRANLRLTDHSGNAANTGSRGGTSQYRGVRRVRSGRWSAYAYIKGVEHRIGLFDVEEDAAAAASAFRREHMPTSEMDR